MLLVTAKKLELVTAKKLKLVTPKKLKLVTAKKMKKQFRKWKVRKNHAKSVQEDRYHQAMK
jgi:hypothetical protein